MNLENIVSEIHTQTFRGGGGGRWVILLSGSLRWYQCRDWCIYGKVAHFDWLRMKHLLILCGRGGWEPLVFQNNGGAEVFFSRNCGGVFDEF